MAYGTHRHVRDAGPRRVSLRADFPGATFAYQPIVDVSDGNVYAYEALLRGLEGESAGAVLSSVPPEALAVFDHEARTEALRLAASLGLTTRLSLNCLPRSLDAVPEAISSLLSKAAGYGIRSDQLILEVTEGEMIRDRAAFALKLNGWRTQGLRFAIDDFGAGYAGLNLLAEFQPDIVKIDMDLVRAIDRHGPRQAIARAVLQASRDLGLEIIAEGVETLEEFQWFRRHGVVLFQGFLIAKPAFQALSVPDLPTLPVKQPSHR